MFDDFTTNQEDAILGFFNDIIKKIYINELLTKFLHTINNLILK